MPIAYLASVFLCYRDSVQPGKKEHALHLCGIFVGNVPVLVRAQLNVDPSAGCILKVTTKFRLTMYRYVSLPRITNRIPDQCPGSTAKMRTSHRRRPSGTSDTHAPIVDCDMSSVTGLRLIVGRYSTTVPIEIVKNHVRIPTRRFHSCLAYLSAVFLCERKSVFFFLPFQKPNC